VRALGNRSILANASSPYTLENLNFFLKKREAHRTYSVSVCLEDLTTYFDGPRESPFMEFDYHLKTPERLKALVPQTTTSVRVQTVNDGPPLLRQVLKAFGSATGTPVLVNTSFNGFNEPIVCTPRDAIRVFYGTGLDVAIIGNFVLRK
jgi:carbamoyltransferase